MVANALCAGIAAIIALVMVIRVGRQPCRGWLILLVTGFGMLTYEILAHGREWPTSVGIVTLATAMIAMLTDSLRTNNRKL